MKKEYFYRVASHLFRIVTDGSLIPHQEIYGFKPFVLSEEDAKGEPVFTIFHTEQRQVDTDILKEANILHRFEFEMIQCIFARHGEEYLFYMIPPQGEQPFYFRTQLGSQKLKAVSGICPPAILSRFLLWTAFGLATLPFQTIAIHSSTICHHGQAVLFLGESGTGKSTHTRLWREHISGSTLLNDDSPILRMEEGKPWIYGSPWSGKTPCYRNERAPLAAIVRLRQAPENRMFRLSSIAALGALLPSCPPLFAYDEALMDCISSTLSGVLAQTPVYTLECRPDQEAARLAFHTIFPDFQL